MIWPIFISVLTAPAALVTFKRENGQFGRNLTESQGRKVPRTVEQPRSRNMRTAKQTSRTG